MFIPWLAPALARVQAAPAPADLAVHQLEAPAPRDNRPNGFANLHHCPLFLLWIDRPLHWATDPRLPAVWQIDDAHFVMGVMAMAYIAALHVQVPEVLAGLDVVQIVGSRSSSSAMTISSSSGSSLNGGSF